MWHNRKWLLMDKLRLTKKASRITLITVIVSVMAGCAQSSDWLKGRRTAKADDPIILGAPEAETYLNELKNLTAGDPATQAEIFADAKSAATLTPGSNTNLRLALVLATPGHAESSPEQAQSLLREVLAQTELLTPAEVSLATIHLNYVERLIVANAEARRLRATSSRAARTEEQAISQRLSSVEAENRKLRRDLEAAEDKLEAITSIERSIREQE
jgi:hypothetical protein